MATYYIATAANGGNNGNAGTAVSPWLTLLYASTHVTNSGDIIHVGTGTFNESDRIVLANGVSIEGEGAGSIIVTDFIAGASVWNDGFISITSGSTAQHISYITLDGNNTGDNAIYVSKSNVGIYHCTIQDFIQQGVRFWGSGQMTSNTLHDCTINSCSQCVGTYRTESISLGYQTGLTIYNINLDTTLRTDPGIGIKIWDSVKVLKIYDSTMIGPRTVSGPEYPFLIEGWEWTKQTGQGMEIYGNTFKGQVDFSSSVKGIYDYGISLHDNVFGYDEADIPADPANGASICLQFEETMEDIYIYRNIFKNTDRMLYFCSNGTSGSCNNINVWDNIFYNIPFNYQAQTTTAGYSAHGVGILFGGGSPFTGAVSNIYIRHNTFVAYTGGPGSAELGIFLPTTNTCNNVRVQNNIFKDFDVAPFSAENCGSGTLSNLYLQNNLYYNNGTNGLVTVGFTVSSSTVTNNITGDPVFVSTSDFHLQVTSPARGAGINVGITTDYDQFTFYDPPAIGAYEYDTGAPPAVVPVTSVTVTGTGGATTISTQNGTLQMIATVLPVDATDKTVVWSVVNGSGTAVISPSGLLTALTNGTVTVIATANG